MLCESGLLPGVLIRNESLTFACKEVHLAVERTDTRFTSELKKGQVLRIPIAHGEGRFTCSTDTMHALETADCVAFRYVGTNPNGSIGDIAGICDPSGVVLGLMPHPERYIRRTQHPHWSRLAEDLDPDGIHTPGIYMDRILQGRAYEMRIEQRTVRKKGA